MCQQVFWDKNELKNKGKPLKTVKYRSENTTCRTSEYACRKKASLGVNMPCFVLMNNEPENQTHER